MGEYEIDIKRYDACNSRAARRIINAFLYIYPDLRITGMDDTNENAVYILALGERKGLARLSGKRKLLGAGRLAEPSEEMIEKSGVLEILGENYTGKGAGDIANWCAAVRKNENGEILKALVGRGEDYARGRKKRLLITNVMGNEGGTYERMDWKITGKRETLVVSMKDLGTNVKNLKTNWLYKLL